MPLLLFLLLLLLLLLLFAAVAVVVVVCCWRLSIITAIYYLKRIFLAAFGDRTLSHTILVIFLESYREILGNVWVNSCVTHKSCIH